MSKWLSLVVALILIAAPALADDQSATAGSAEGVTVTMKGVNLTFGGFLEAAGFYRTKNDNSDISSKYQILPLSNQAAYYQDETKFSARQSRLSLLVTSNYSSTIRLGGYYEMDFLGAAPTANYNESNSFNLRIRHLYATVDWDSSGWHLLAGQTWSLVTMNNMGITPRNENIPLTIDAQYVPGFSWARQPQFRIVKDWGKKVWFAVSVENPQTVAASTPNTVPANSGLSQAGQGSLTNVSISANTFPDVVGKLAVEPGWGHYEVFGLVRTFKSTIIANNVANGTELTTGAIGGGALFPVLKQLSLQIRGMYGDGIGRYGSGQLPDVCQDSTGLLHGIKAAQLLAGLTWKPSNSLTFYGNYGFERAEKNDLAVGGLAYGYGSILDPTAVGAPGTSANFKGQIQTIDQFTAGFWWKFFQGKFGNMQTGLQYSYTENKYFAGTAGAPKADDNMVFLSLRFYWQ